MARPERTDIGLRIVVERPVAGVLHSLQSGDDTPLDSRTSAAGEPLRFDFRVSVAAGPKFYGDQVRREGPQRRFVYIRIGRLAGDPASPWTRRMKVDIHDIEPTLLERAAAGEGVVAITIDGTGRDGTPACATVRRTSIGLA